MRSRQNDFELNVRFIAIFAHLKAYAVGPAAGINFKQKKFRTQQGRPVQM